jgi:hypothetical protein
LRVETALGRSQAKPCPIRRSHTWLSSGSRRVTGGHHADVPWFGRSELPDGAAAGKAPKTTKRKATFFEALQYLYRPARPGAGKATGALWEISRTSTWLPRATSDHPGTNRIAGYVQAHCTGRGRDPNVRAERGAQPPGGSVGLATAGRFGRWRSTALLGVPRGDRSRRWDSMSSNSPGWTWRSATTDIGRRMDEDEHGRDVGSVMTYGVQMNLPIWRHATRPRQARA